MAKFNVTGDQHYGITGQLLEIQKQLRLAGGSPLDPELVKIALQDIIEKRFYSKSSPNVLRLISAGQSLVLKALNGNRLICEASETFKSHIGSDFVYWGLNRAGVATPETPVRVDEMTDSATFMDIFRSLPGTWNQKWLSQDQIIEFCETLSDWLRQDGYATMFLCKINENKPVDESKPENNLVVVNVDVHSVGLSVFVFRLENGHLWLGKDRRRVVSPQLVPSVI